MEGWLRTSEAIGLGMTRSSDEEELAWSSFIIKTSVCHWQVIRVSRDVFNSESRCVAAAAAWVERNICDGVSTYCTKPMSFS